MSNDVLVSLDPLKPSWKNASVVVPLECFSSKADFELAFTELFACKEIEVLGSACFEPHSLLRFPAILQCKKLNVRALCHPLAVNDLVEWLEHEKPKQWTEPTSLKVDNAWVIGDAAALVDALKKAFMEAARPSPYTVRTYGTRGIPTYYEHKKNKKTKERMSIKSVMGEWDGYRWWSITTVERK